MTSYEFEVAAKNLVIEHNKEVHKRWFTIGDINIVWFTHILNNKKAILIDNDPENNRMYEVTYNAAGGVFYFDEYEKTVNRAIFEDKVKTTV